MAEIARRRKAYRGVRPLAEVRGRTAIVVDDGIATGASMRAALIAVRRAAPRALVLAVPVAAPDTLGELARCVDDVVCPMRPADLGAIGMYYRDFHQLPDDEAIACLDEASGPLGGV